MQSFIRASQGQIGNCTTVILYCSDPGKTKHGLRKHGVVLVKKNNESSYGKGKHVLDGNGLGPLDSTLGFWQTIPEKLHQWLWEEEGPFVQSPGAAGTRRAPSPRTQRFPAPWEPQRPAPDNPQLLGRAKPPALRVLGSWHKGLSKVRRGSKASHPHTQTGTLTQEWTPPPGCLSHTG